MGIQMADYPIVTSDQLRGYLKAVRQTRGMTQQQLADRLGVTRPRVWKIEQSPGDVTLDNLLLVLTALGVHLTLRVEDEPTSPMDGSRGGGDW